MSKAVKSLMMKDLTEQLSGVSDVVFVDLRDPRELEREGTIPSALHAPRGMLEFWVDPASPYHKPVFSAPGKRYVVFCAGGWRSALAAKTMQDMGLTAVGHVDGGFTAWKAAGAPVGSFVAKSHAPPSSASSAPSAPTKPGTPDVPTKP